LSKEPSAGLEPGSEAAKTRALVVGPYPARSKDAARDPAARLAEAVGLAQAIDLDICGEVAVALNEVRPAPHGSPRPWASPRRSISTFAGKSRSR
jgi:GTPase